ncbi:aminodeoxychorismate synthase component I [Sulfitobacter sp. KE29]|uniref:aminodeoxychorismate synthase component I n=1 Tax=unclassified Sulfitobacter TaxID=196795 RepID=UPI0007C2A843|nr:MULTISPECIES: aminodeoxychorismate synthase component I [unclassified Sulfitobacter]KZY51933.1 aminodeoxychorismate synthase component I [Sulfitobacter sp. HI0054]MBO9437936.1 aminodeoxychorismate synthase component I [Sulfitobacter sp. R18_2]MDF3418753.1 aminodeoxychorismate synthase component I [Sulfitobacter sp. Ks38]MDF3426162.1 aminodeoxychorismate synthase component I [Sulfitobacter sp. KE29]MDF3429742.1 aminodeoxychorismate synthase component I [Sulfitobacter sp. S46]
MAGPRVLFDTGPLGHGTAFTAPRRIISADTPAEVPAAFAALEAAQESGAWLAGYASYELGYLGSHKLRELMPAARGLPLLRFGVFDAPEAYGFAEDAGDASLSALTPDWDFAQYQAAFAEVQDFISAGDIYQANLTFGMEGRYTGTPAALYARLRQRQSVAHGAFVDLGGPVLLSRSPELFFALTAEGQLTARPMKGTARRGRDAGEDAKLRGELAASEKNMAENLMIVDLLRNDISRIAEVGSVEVPKLFEIETYETLHQMTSRITAQVLPGKRLTDLFHALFPCGSITGAPKIRAMQILRALEPAPRDAYCGAVGWIAPTGAMQFNVAIRTATCHPEGRLRLNVGGGVVHDSTAEDEYAEALLKARFATLT